MEDHPELSPAEATRQAMLQITGPIIAITLVLLSVFVPVGFIPGLSGVMFRQFAVTISCAMLISALNALTLSPALCAVFLRHRPRRGIMGRLLGGIDRVRNGYAAVVQRLIRFSLLSVVVIAGFAVGIYIESLSTPTGFLPTEDQGAFFIAVQLPDGASVPRTELVAERVEKILHGMPQVADTLAIIGFSLLDGAQEPNSAFLVARLKPFADRVGAANSVEAVIGRTFGAVQQIRSALVFPFNLPPIIGLGTGAGFEYQLEALQGQDPSANGSVMQGLIAAANQDPRLSHVFSTFTATNPSLFLDIDRDKAQALGLNISDIFTALSATLGGVYINNFNLYGRTWQVIIEGEAADRADIPAIWQIYVRNSRGLMVPLRSVASLRIVTGPQVVTRYNNYRSITINGGPAPGVSSGDALAAMAEVSAKTLPPGYGFEWTGTAFQEELAAGRTGLILGLAGTVRISVPGGSVRELDDPHSGAAVRDGRRPGVVYWVTVRRTRARSLCADRPGRADRAGGQERHPDRGVRERTARTGFVDPRGGVAGRTHALSRGHDDVGGVHSGAGAVGMGDRSGTTKPARRGDRGVRRNDRCKFYRDIPDPDAVCHVPGNARGGEGSVRRPATQSVRFKRPAEG